jgi:hypothetical protein
LIGTNSFFFKGEIATTGAEVGPDLEILFRTTRKRLFGPIQKLSWEIRTKKKIVRTIILSNNEIKEEKLV